MSEDVERSHNSPRPLASGSASGDRPHQHSAKENASGRANAERSKPVWADTPVVAKSLHQQRKMNPEDIFGQIQPVKLEGMKRDDRAPPPI